MRVIFDGRITDGISFYEKFPFEPSINPDSIIDISLNSKGKVDPNDVLKPPSLLRLMERLLTVQEDRVIICCHGTPDGLAIPVTDNPDTPGARQETLHDFNQFGDAKVKIDAILRHPPAPSEEDEHTQAKPLAALLNGLRSFKGQPLFDPQVGADQEPASYKSLFNKLLDSYAKGNKISRAELDQVLDRRQKLSGKFARIEVRACNIGKNPKYLRLFREFFGTKQVVAPKVLYMDGVFHADIVRSFSADGFEKTTRPVARAHQPVRADAKGKEVALDLADLPPTRTFDVASAAGDEVFLRIWLTQIHPHHAVAGWMVAKSRNDVREFLKQKVAADTSRYRDGEPVQLGGLWLRGDDNSVIAIRAPVKSDAPLGDDSPLPPFALPLDPEYRMSLVSDPP